MAKVTKQLIIECGFAQTRAALLIDDVVWKFWFGPARGDEASDVFPAAGRRFAGRVTRIDKTLAAAFVDFGGDQDGFLPLKKNAEEHCIEGAMIAALVKAPPRQGKGALFRFVEALESAAAPGRLPPVSDPVVEAVTMIGGEANEIVVDDGAAVQTLKAAGVKTVSLESRPVSLFASTGADHALSEALERRTPLGGGGCLYIDEAQALTAIDVDTGAQQASSSARLREKIACAAAREAIRQISLRNISGHVVIDFPDIPGDAGRKRFNEQLRKSMKLLPGAGAASFSKSGLFSFTLPHHSQSLLAHFTEPEECGPMTGRRFTVEALAKRALCELEMNLRCAPSARYLLSVGSEIEHYMTTRPQWRERLLARYGARFQIAGSEAGEGRAYDLSEQ